MSNLQNNIASLEALITKANALPEEKTIQSSKTVTPATSSQTIKPDSGYDGMGQVVVNAMPTATQATPSVSIDSAGKITATATQSAGYVAAGTKTDTKQLTTQAAKTITPTKSSQTAVAKNVYTTGAVTVAAIPSQYITTTDASAAADDIVTGETAYVNGVKVTGTNPYEKAATDTTVGIQEALLDEIIAMLPVVLPPVGTPLNNVSWEDISAISQSGKAANYFSIGETKEIVINGQVGDTTFDNLSVWAFILGFDHNSDIEGNNTIHFQIGKTAQTNGTDICLIDSKYNSSSSSSGYFNMNYSNSNSGGWYSSKMRTVLLGSDSIPTSPLSGSLMAALPSDLRKVMRVCYKYSDNVGGSSNTASNVNESNEYLWLLAEYEVFGTRSYANSAEQNYQQQYVYYANGNSKVKYRHSATSSTAFWWLRSTSATNSHHFCLVNTYGSVAAYPAYYSYGLAPVFCV